MLEMVSNALRFSLCQSATGYENRCGHGFFVCRLSLPWARLGLNLIGLWRMARNLKYRFKKRHYQYQINTLVFAHNNIHISTFM